MVYQTPEAVYSIQGYHPRALMRPKLCYRNDYYKLTIIEKGACIIFSRVLVPEQQILESSSKYVYPDPVVLRQLSPGLLLLALTELDISYCNVDSLHKHLLSESAPDRMSSPQSSSPPPTNIHPATPTSNQNRQNRPLSEIIGETFPPFDHQAHIVKPFNDETNRDSVFERGSSFTLFFWMSCTRKATYVIDFDLYLMPCTCNRVKDAHIAHH